MTKCWIKTDYVPEGCDYITIGKWYESKVCEDEGVEWTDENNNSRWTELVDTFHLDYRDWQVHYGENPPVSPECSTSNNITQGDTNVVVNTSLPVNEVQDVTEEVMFLSNIYDTYCPYTAEQCYWADSLQELLDKLKSGEYSIIHNTNIN